MIRGALRAWLAAAAWPAATAHAYDLLGPRWTATPVPMHLQLGTSPTPLSDGSASWGAVAEAALNLWNASLGGVKFSAVRNSTATRAEGNALNNVFFSSDIYGDGWGSGVLAVTLYYTAGSRFTETDVLFNSRLNWDSYRGPQRRGANGAIFDFHRVALHEFGHALGLDHPDQAGQAVTALMNSFITDLDTLTSDDLAGGRALYGAPIAASAPPVIVAHPASQSAVAGQTVTFTVGVTSDSAVNYQWLKGGAPLASATAATLRVGPVALSDAGTYAVVVTNAAASLTSASAVLTVTAPVIVTAPTIVSGPASQTVLAGDGATFNVNANGTAPLGYQWFRDGAMLSGATSSVLAVQPVRTSDAGSYTVRISNSAGAITSAPAMLTVHTAPVVTAAPQPQTVIAGSPVSFSAAATGNPPPTFQWRKDGAAIAGATSATFTLARAQVSDAGSYEIVASNRAGSSTSAAATLTVHTPPVILTPPVSQTVAAGTAATFAVVATGSPAVSYQWRRNALELPGETSAVLTLVTTRPSDAANYSVVVRNSAGSVASGDAVLRVNHSRLINLSTRGYVPPGGALTPGFVVRGAGSKPLVLRAIGPGLAVFGLPDTLPAAQLSLIAADGTGVMLSNARWTEAAELSAAFASVGAFPLRSESRDAAARVTVGPGAYSVRVAAADESGSGLALAEVYDASEADSPARLVNASTLGFAGAGARALIPGFVIGGNVGKRVLIRAVGPGLAPFGVSGALANPALQVFAQGAGAPLADNDDWGGTPALQAAFTAAGAFSLEPASRDAALVLSLAPGAYSILVASAETGSGHVLVEIYDLD